MTILQALSLLWILFILSAGAACGSVACKTWQLRKRHRVFRYIAMVKTMLFLSTVNSSYGIVPLISTNGLKMFDSLTPAQHRGLVISTGLAVTLWLLALYLFNKINGSL